MARVRQTSDVSDWLFSVAKVLPLPHRAFLPYTLGDAVTELGAYAQAIDASEWDSNFVKSNLDALKKEIKAQSGNLGKRLSAVVDTVLVDLLDGSTPETVIAAAARFNETWHSKRAIANSFRDLCDAAKDRSSTSRALRKLSSIIASQVGPAAHGHFSVPSRAADALIDTEEDLTRRRDSPFSEPLTEAHRLAMATDILVAAPAGRIVVWLVYFRAITALMREVIGPMTFLRAEWALPNAFDIELNDFPERTELREIRMGAPWLDDINVKSRELGNRFVLVRVDLGQRQVAGAVEEARRRIEAVLSIATEAGGTSWRDAGADAVLLDGKVHGSSLGLDVRDTVAPFDDSYGMGATADTISYVADQLGAVLTKEPMPEPLVEALTSLREARMTDHRDVLFYGARRVNSRVATALEDHAMELFASVLKVKPKAFAEALQYRETLNRTGRRIAEQLMSPFNEAWSLEHHEGREELKRTISKYSQGGLVVSIAKVIAFQDEIRALPMSDLQRADFEDALAICVDPNREEQFVDEMWRETGVLRSRHRRVRNAVNHGLPLHETTLNSIRDYADCTSSFALNIALTWFKNRDTGATLVQREESAWADRIERIGRGESWAAHDVRFKNES